MSFLDRVGNKVEHMKSKQSESSEINAIKKKIKDLDDQSDILSSDIALFYWNLYAKGELDPPAEIIDKFKAIEANNAEVEKLKADIDARKEAGIVERQQIDENTEKKIAQKEADAAERRKQREEAKAAAAEKKAAEKAAADSPDGSSSEQDRPQ